MSALDLALVALFLPVVVATFALVVAPFRRAGLPMAFLSVLTALAAVAASITLFVQFDGQAQTHAFDWLVHASGKVTKLGIHLDGVSISMLVVVTLVATCVQVFSLGYLGHEPAEDIGRYYTWQSLFLFAMNSLVLAPNLLQLFLGWELVGLCSYLLIGYYYKKPSAARAALKAFWVTKFADMGLLVALIVLFVDTGGFEWTGTVAVAGVVTLGLFVAVMGKSAQFPLHIWLPDAMEGPTPVSALLHAATMVAAGVFLVVRADPLFAQAPDTQMLMAYIGGFTALFAACIAVVQTDIKKILAYSTCSQLGYMVCALGAASQVAGFFHLTTHAFFKALLFLAAGSLIHAVHSNELEDMGGLWKKMKLTSVVFVIGALALAGFPGFAGFFSKDLILEAVYQKGLWLPLAALMVAAFLTAFYMGRAVFLALFGELSEAGEHAHESGPTMTIPLVVLAALSLGVGWFGTPLAKMYGQEYHFHIGAVGLTTSALGLLGIALSYWMFGPPKGGAELRAAFAPVGRLARSGAVDGLFLAGYRHGLMAIGGVCDYLDRYVVDGLMNFSAWITLEAGSRIRATVTGNVQHYLYAVVIGLLAMGAYGVLNA